MVVVIVMVMVSSVMVMENGRGDGDGDGYCFISGIDDEATNPDLPPDFSMSFVCEIIMS